MKNVTTFASGEDLIIGQLNDQLIACTKVDLSLDYRLPQNFVRNFTKILVTKSDFGVLATFFYKTGDGLHMTTMKTEFEDVYGKNYGQDCSNLF